MSDESANGAVYVQTDDAENAVVVFRRAADGTLERLGSYPTGGAGQGTPHLTSQGSVVLTGNGEHLLVANAGSDEVTVLAVAAEGPPEVVGRSPAGATPM